MIDDNHMLHKTCEVIKIEVIVKISQQVLYLKI